MKPVELSGAGNKYVLRGVTVQRWQLPSVAMSATHNRQLTCSDTTYTTQPHSVTEYSLYELEKNTLTEIQRFLDFKLSPCPECCMLYVEIKCQLDATEVFIADLIACSTCFGHHYAHHQELKSIIQWFLPVVFRAVVFQVAGLVWS